MSGSPIFRADGAGDPCERDVALAPLTTFGVSATAHRLFRFDSLANLDAVLAAVADSCVEVGQARGCNEPVRPFVLGGGSNLLLTRDLDEPVLLMRLLGRGPVDDDPGAETVLVDVAAGETWHDTVRWTLESGWYGLENLALIPGLAGGAPWQNIGAYGVEVAERIESVEAVRLQDGLRRRFAAPACEFGYRSSFFKSLPGRDWLILSLRLRLSRRADVRTGYGEVAAELARRSGSGSAGSFATSVATPLAVAAAIEAIRRRKLPDPAQIGNAGSFFKNPIVGSDIADRLRADHPALPLYPTEREGQVKLSAGWLIEAAGWKGFRDGDAGVSAQHALVLVNHGRASGADLLALARRIQHSVSQRFGVTLEPEPVIVS